MQEDERSSNTSSCANVRHFYSNMHFNKHNINPKNDSLIAESQLPLVSRWKEILSSELGGSFPDLLTFNYVDVYIY